jgi:TnpA family transposase
MPRIQLLKDSEIKAFDSPAQFTEDERKQFFNFDDLDKDDAMFRKPITKIGFVLQRGYFLAHHKFFPINKFVKHDIDFVISLVIESDSVRDLKSYREATYRLHQKNILEQYGYRPFKEFKSFFIDEAHELVKTSLRPREIFHTLITALNDKKIEIPTYYVFADTLTNSLNSFEQDLSTKVGDQLTIVQKDILDDLISIPAGDDEVSAQNPYLITELKKPIQATTPRKIRESLNKFEIIRDLHNEFSEVLDSNIISNELLNYYAVWIIKAEHIQFDGIRDTPKKHLYLIAFIVYQYRIRQDLFIDTFLQATKRFLNETERLVAADFINQIPAKQEQVKQIKDIVISSKKQLEQVKQIIFANNYQDRQKITLLTDLLSTGEKPFHEELLDKLKVLENSGAAHLKDQMYFSQLSKGYRKISNRVSGIILIIEFNPLTSDVNIIEAIQFYQVRKGKITSKSPAKFIKKNELKWAWDEDGSFNPQIYKALLFREIADHLKAGSLNLKFSDKYKSLDEYLISSSRWELESNNLLERANLMSMFNFDKFIPKLKEQLHQQFEETNLNIAQNDHLKFSRDGRPIVTTPKLEEIESDKIIDILGRENFLPLIQVLSDIDDSSNFISCFHHYSRKGAKKQPPNELFFAAIIAIGCNIGVRKMGKISKGIGPDKLEYAVRWYLSKQNIEEANRRIITLTNELSLPKIFIKDKDKLHTSSDGQKFNVAVPSLHATYSFKYFGTGKGVSAYSFIDEQSRLFYDTVISASEREAAYVIDGLMHNEEIESKIHSTDTHGYSEIVFGVANALGIFFAPRIKNYKDQLLYTFKDKRRKYYEAKDFQILPSKSMHIDDFHLKEQWDNVLRLICSVKLRETTASKLFRRLSSYSKQHPLYKALKEFGRIYKTIFILRYLNETPLRQGIEKQLNRVEQSHQFARAIFFGNSQEFRVDTKEEQEIAVSCRHLIQNAIVLWNYLNISDQLTKITDNHEREDLLKIIENSSIMTWQHINMHGEYDFERMDNQKSTFNLEEILNMKIN